MVSELCGHERACACDKTGLVQSIIDVCSWPFLRVESVRCDCIIESEFGRSKSNHQGTPLAVAAM